MNKSHALSDQIPIHNFDGDLLVFSDGSLGAGFRIEGVDISSSSEEEVNEINRKLEGMITSLPEGTSLQLFYRMSPHAKDIIARHEKISSNGNNFCQRIARDRIQFIQENQSLGRHFSPDLLLFVKGPPLHYKRASLFGKDARYSSVTCKEYGDHKKYFKRVVKSLESAADFLNPTKLSKEEWFSLLFEYFNVDRKERVGAPNLRNENNLFSPGLGEQFLLTDVGVGKGSLKIGGLKFAIITMKNLPEGATFASMGGLLLKTPVHFWLVQNIHIPDQKAEFARLGLARRVSHAMASGSGNMTDIESESKFMGTEDLMRELVEGSEKLLSSDLNIIVWGRSEQELAEKEDEVLKAFRTMNRAEGVRETLPLFDLFTGIFPGACKGLRLKKMKSSNAAHLMPVYSWWKGDADPVCLLTNRENMPFSINPFAPELPNWNTLVFGGSGSGKSFTVSQLMLQFYGSHPPPKIVWIDNGESSKNLTESLDGSFIDLRPDSGVCINMFDLGENTTRPDGSKIKLILAVLESILKDEEKRGLPKREKALLEESIVKTYEMVGKKVPILSDLIGVLAKHSSKEMRIFGEMLRPWTGGGAYGQMLDGETNVRFEKNLLSLEMRGLDEHPELQAVLMLLITDFVKREASRDLKNPYLLIIDEGWKLFATPSGLAFTVEAFRTFRKFNGGIWCISQNHRDFLGDEEIRNALLPNAASLFILPRKKFDRNDFQETFDFNSEEMAVIESLEFEKGNYGEFFLIREDKKAVVRLVPDPLSYWTCTTDAKDKAVIEEMTRKHPEASKSEILQMIVDGIGESG